MIKYLIQVTWKRTRRLLLTLALTLLVPYGVVVYAKNRYNIIYLLQLILLMRPHNILYDKKCIGTTLDVPPHPRVIVQVPTRWSTVRRLPSCAGERRLWSLTLLTKEKLLVTILLTAEFDSIETSTVITLCMTMVLSLLWQQTWLFLIL